MAFKKGAKPGPGRPKGSTSSRPEFLKKWCQTKGLQGLIDIAESTDPGFRIHPQTGKVIRTGWSDELKFEARALALAYGLGKPTEHHELTGEDGTPLVIEVVKFAKG